jgi:uroporphyrinogen-III synthase
MPGASSRAAPVPTSSRRRDGVRLLVTRPEPDGERTAAALRARGCEVVAVPLLRIETLEDVDFGEEAYGALALTSAHAAEVATRHQPLMALPVFVVGRRTEAAARAAGFTQVASADGDVQALARLIAGRYRGGVPLLYLAGEDRAGDLAAALATADITVGTIVAYRAVAAMSLPPAIRDALAGGGFDGVLHYSQRSAEVYLECAKAAGVLDRALRPSHYCLSRQVAAPLAAAGAADVRVAPRPQEAALIELVVPS